MKKNIGFLVCAAAAICFHSSCSKPGGTGKTAVSKATVLFVNGCVNSGTVDFLLNNTATTGATSLGYIEVHSFQLITSGSQTVGFEQTGSSTPISTTYNFAAKGKYTIFAGGTWSTPSASLLIATDDTTAPPSGFCKVRLINLSPDTLSATMYMGDSASVVTSGIASKGISSYYQVAATASTSFTAADPAQPGLTIHPANGQTLVSGKIYSYVIFGTHQVATGTGSLALVPLSEN